MSRHNEIGNIGEQLAKKYLESKDIEILETNWRFGRAEIDIIAKSNEILVFVEVKTRSNDFFGQPEEFIDEKKEGLVSDAANAYMQKINYDWAIRFDIISIIYKSRFDYSIQHIEDAWW